jgi:dihydroxyacetone kinase-like predicted kinase
MLDVLKGSFVAFPRMDLSKEFLDRMFMNFYSVQGLTLADSVKRVKNYQNTYSIHRNINVIKSKVIIAEIETVDDSIKHSMVPVLTNRQLEFLAIAVVRSFSGDCSKNAANVAYLCLPENSINNNNNLIVVDTEKAIFSVEDINISKFNLAMSNLSIFQSDIFEKSQMANRILSDVFVRHIVNTCRLVDNFPEY